MIYISMFMMRIISSLISIRLVLLKFKLFYSRYPLSFHLEDLILLLQYTSDCFKKA